MWRLTEHPIGKSRGRSNIDDDGRSGDALDQPRFACGKTCVITHRLAIEQRPVSRAWGHYGRRIIRNHDSRHSSNYFSSMTSVRYVLEPRLISTGASSPLLCQMTSPDLRSRIVFSLVWESVRS